MVSEDLKIIKNNAERIITGFKTKKLEFLYRDTSSFVKPDITYTIYYTEDKREIFLTGIPETKNSREIVKSVNDSIFSQYSEIHNYKKTSYPEPYTPILSKEDYNKKTLFRYFTQAVNDETNYVFEISKDTFESKNSLYKYNKTNWTIFGIKNEVERLNTLKIQELQEDFPKISKILFPLQYWNPENKSVDDLKNKLKRLKK